MISKVVSAAAVAALADVRCRSCVSDEDGFLQSKERGQSGCDAHEDAGWREQNEWYAGNDFGKILNVAKRHGRMSRSHEQGHEDGNDEIEENVTRKGPGK